MKTSSQTDEKCHPIIINILKNRGHDSEAIESLLSWDLKKLPKLIDLKDMDKASDRLILAIANNEKIGVFGDYDVDGTTSCAVLYHFFKLLKQELFLIQPSRFIEGYGLHNSSIDKSIEEGVKVLITVDCGITNNEAAEYAKSKGIDLIITDHHKDAKEVMPNAYAIINPNRRDEPKDSPLAHLAGVGVAFALCLSITRKLSVHFVYHLPVLEYVLPCI